MTATLHGQTGATGVTSILDFDVIKQRVADIRKIDKRDVTDIMLGEFFGVARETIWRFRAGAMKPSLPSALAMAQKLGLSVEQITAKSQPGPTSPPPPPGPSKTGE